MLARAGRQPRKPRFARAPRPVSERDELLRSRAEAEAAIAEARKSHERLRQAIDLLPQGIVFLDAEGRYVLWNRKYAEIYSKTADLFEEGARLEDTLRIGVARGDYPEAAGHEDEWIAERLQKLYQPGARHEQMLADGRVILIDERLTDDGGVVGLRVDITELKQREASFRLLFDGNPVPMIVCALDDERILGVNDAAISHYGYSRAEFEKLKIRSLQAFDSEPPWTTDHSSEEQAARTWKHVKANGALIDLAIYSRELTYADRPAGRITGFEALVRWPHAERGMVSPAEFIPVAEETGLINPLGGLMLRRACLDAATWPDDVRVAVNLSPLQFRSGNLLSVVTDALKHSGLPARQLELEITETLLLEKSAQVLATLHALRALGVRISMDDFGTGYSSLSYLRSFPFDKIKIDQSFVRDLGANREAQAIIRSIVSLGKGLGVTITAEGVETEAELSCLRAEGCDEGQGFLFSKARPNVEIISLLAAQRGIDGETALVA